jgi:hypothetical protein
LSTLDREGLRAAAKPKIEQITLSIGSIFVRSLRWESMEQIRRLKVDKQIPEAVAMALAGICDAEGKPLLKAKHPADVELIAEMPGLDLAAIVEKIEELSGGHPDAELAQEIEAAGNS